MTAAKIIQPLLRPWNPILQFNCLTLLSTKGSNFQHNYTEDNDSTTEAHIHQKVTYSVYGIEKFSDVVHIKRSLTTRLYNLNQSDKFINCSSLLQKVINYLVKCFSYGLDQNKGDSKGIQASIKCIVPHAFGDHNNCLSSWCGFKEDPVSYRHKELP